MSELAQPHCGTAGLTKDAGSPRGAGGNTSVSLPVLGSRNAWEKSGHSKIKHSRTGKWRALVLVLVHIAMAIHIIQWLITGSTLTPVEPSESMQTLRDGQVNAGFIFFALALLSTLIFGRVFCGWGCHVVALQDLCAWLMMKLGVKPKPFRSRLLLLIPLAMALYMFVWPVVHREVVRPLFADSRGRLPEWLGQVNPIPGVTAHLITKDFWATFAPWYVAIPFLLVCAAALVYFLGSKAFCTYGCPYGGFFAPVDSLSVGKIVVNDQCHQCGHCTAVCTSNVRVHEEVRDFGKVMDPGCMKCFDCVSVCPNGALSFGFSRPTWFSRPKDDAAKARAKKAKAMRAARYDLSWGEEFSLALLWLAIFWCYRGMLNMVPMLMAIGMAGCVVFLVHKSWRLIRDPHVRLQSLQLKYKGRIRRSGWVTLCGAIIAMTTAAWSGYVRANLWLADWQFSKLRTPLGIALSPAFAPSPSESSWARQGLEHFKMADAPPVGIGWPLGPDERLNAAYMRVLTGDLRGAQADLERIIDEGRPQDSLIFQLAQIMQAQSPPASQDAIAAMYERAAARHPTLYQVRALLSKRRMDAGDRAGALAEWDTLLSDKKLVKDPAAMLGAAGALVQLEDRTRAGIVARQAAALKVATPDQKLQASSILAQVDESTAAAKLAEEAARESERTSLGSVKVAAANQLATLARADLAYDTARQGAADAGSRGRYLGQADTFFNAGAVLIGVGKSEEGLALVRQAATIMNGGGKVGAEGGGWDALAIGRYLLQRARTSGDKALASEALAIIDRARFVPGVSDSPMFLLEHAQAAYAADKLDVALESMRLAAEIGATSAYLADRYASLLTDRGRVDEGQKWKAEARRRLESAGGK